MMRYQLDYTVWREVGNGVFRKEHGSLMFNDVHSAQEWCSSPSAMLCKLEADYGKFDMRCGEKPFYWEWVWEFEYDFERPTNRIPVAYRMWRDAIFNMSA